MDFVIVHGLLRDYGSSRTDTKVSWRVGAARVFSSCVTLMMFVDPNADVNTRPQPLQQAAWSVCPRRLASPYDVASVTTASHASSTREPRTEILP